MGRIKGWKKVIDKKYNRVYHTNKNLKGFNGGEDMPISTIHIVGKTVMIMKSVPAPREGWFINKIIYKKDFTSKLRAKYYATKYMRKHPNG